MKIRELFVALGVEADLGAVENFEKGLGNVRAKAGALVKTMAAMASAFVGVGVGAVSLAKQTSAYARTVDNQSRSLGLSTRAFQEYQHAFGEFGADASDVSDVFNTLTDRAEDAKDGMQSFIDDFRLVGLEVDDLRGKSPEQLFDTFSSAVANTTDINRRNAAVVRILGDDVGNKLLPLLSQGADGMAEFRREAHRLGVVMDADAIAASRKFGDNLRKMRRWAEGLRNTFATALMPTLNDLTRQFLAWARANQEVINQRLEKLAERIGAAFRWAGNTAKALDSIAQSLGGWSNVLKAVAASLAAMGLIKVIGQVISLGVAVKGFMASVGPLMALINQVTGGFGALSALIGKTGLVGALKVLAIALAKPLAIAAAVVGVVIAIGLAIQDLLVFARGGDSLIGRFLEKFGLADDARRLIASLGDILKEIGAIIMSLARIYLRVWIAQWKLLWPVVKPILMAIGWLVAQTIKVAIDWALKWADAFLLAFRLIAAGLKWIEDRWSSWVDGVKQLGTDAVDTWKNAWSSFVDWFMGMIDGLLGKFGEFKEGMLSIPGVQAALDMGGGIIGRVQNAFAPSPENHASPRGVSNSVSQSAQVNVNVSQTNATPQQIASATSQGIEEANARNLRLTQAALAGGEL